MSQEFLTFLLTNQKSNSPGFLAPMSMDYKPEGSDEVIPAGSLMWHPEKPRDLYASDGTWVRPQHLYVFANERPKNGDFFIELDLKGTRRSYANKIFYCDIGETNAFILTKEDGNFPFPEHCYKLVATSDYSFKGIPKVHQLFIASCINRYNSGDKFEVFDHFGIDKIDTQVRDFQDGEIVLIKTQQMLEMVVAGATLCLKGWRYELAIPKKDGKPNKARQRRYHFGENLMLKDYNPLK